MGGMPAGMAGMAGMGMALNPNQAIYAPYGSLIDLGCPQMFPVCIGTSTT